jgi:SAM-dependent methyltransferase
MSQLTDRWSAAEAYESFMGRWSRALAREFVRWLDAPPDLHWLELGCGTGALTIAICAQTAPASVLACDPAESFLEYARAHCRDDRVSFVPAGAVDFPLRQGGYGSITSLLALNFFADIPAALRRMQAAATINCLVSACVWDYAGGMQFLHYFWDAAVATNPAAALHHEGTRFPVCRRDVLVDLFRAAGLSDIRCDPLEIDTIFADFDDCWKPLEGGTGPAPSFVASLAPRERAMLREQLQATLPIGADGRIPLRARAWAVQGRRV